MQEKETLNNKAVNVTSDDFVSQSEQNDESPLEEVRQHLQNVIDHMGPETPHYRFTTTTSTECLDGDNEESYFESTSIISSVVQIKQIQMQEQACDTLDSSEVSALPPDTQRTECQDAEAQVPSDKTLPEQCHRHCYCPNPLYGFHLQPCYIPYQSFPPQPSPVCYPTPIALPAETIPPTCTHEKENAPPKSVRPAAPCTQTDRYFVPKNTGRVFAFLDCFRKSREKDKFVKLYAENPCEHNPPRKLVFDLVKGIPQPCMNTISTNTAINTKNIGSNTAVKKTQCSSINTESVLKCHGVGTGRSIAGFKSTSAQAPCAGLTFSTRDKLHTDRSRSESSHLNRFSQDRNRLVRTCKGNRDAKVEVYYFDHGNSAYYCTTDCPPVLGTDYVAEKSEQCARRFWAESFGTLYIGVALVTAFILQLFKFLLYAIIRPLTIGLLQLACDYFFKPFLTIVFNGVIQPILIFFYNVATSLRDLCDPVAEGCGYFLHELAFLCRSVRLFDYKSQKCNKECKEKKSKCCPSPKCVHKKQEVINIPSSCCLSPKSGHKKQEAINVLPRC